MERIKWAEGRLAKHCIESQPDLLAAQRVQEGSSTLQGLTRGHEILDVILLSSFSDTPFEVNSSQQNHYGGLD